MTLLTTFVHIFGNINNIFRYRIYRNIFLNIERTNTSSRAYQEELLLVCWPSRASHLKEFFFPPTRSPGLLVPSYTPVTDRTGVYNRTCQCQDLLHDALSVMRSWSQDQEHRITQHSVQDQNQNRCCSTCSWVAATSRTLLLPIHCSFICFM